MKTTLSPSGIAAIGCAMAAFLLAGVSAHARDNPSICLAPASAQIPDMRSDEAGTAVGQMFTSYLTGPSLSVVPLTARLASQAREEARQKNCVYVLFASVRQERKTQTTGLLGRIAAGALQNGASQVAANTGSAGTRVVASAAAGGAANTYIASSTRIRDTLELEYRLESADGKTLTAHTEKRKATSDGEDLLTPLVEQAAEAVASKVTSARS
jgi:hypothetical protein